MIIGNGLIATAFNKFGNDSVIIFASGVSNSVNPTVEDCLREETLIKTFTNSKKQFVYFSSCSIFDTTMKDSIYVNHKIRMEKLIEDLFQNYLIVRLPIVVGKSNNPNTHINSLVTKINNDNELTIFTRASRYLIDVDCVAFWVNKLINKYTV